MFRHLMFLTACAPFLLLASQPSALAQTRSEGGKVGEKCEPEKRKKRNSLLGSVIGSVADTALGRAGVPSGIAGVYIPVGSLLSEAIISQLDCKEQVQAATATNEAVRGGVGTSAAWQSESRPNVSGSSTVKSQTAMADGSDCMLITDVVIVEGEETTVEKRMCRSPGGENYVIAV